MVVAYSPGIVPQGALDAYLSRAHLEDLDGSCPLIGLPSDVARSSKSVKAAYREIAESMIRVFESDLNAPDAHQNALVLVALCVGAMVLARAVDDQALGDDFRNGALRHAVATTGWSEGDGASRADVAPAVKFQGPALTA